MTPEVRHLHTVLTLVGVAICFTGMLFENQLAQLFSALAVNFLAFIELFGLWQK